MKRAFGILVAGLWALPVVAQSPPVEVLPAPSAPAHSYPAGVVDVTPEVLPGRHDTHCGTPACDSPAPFVIYGEYLLVTARRRDTEFASLDPRNNLAPEQTPARLDPGTSNGLRAGFLYRPNGGSNDIAFTYTYITSNDEQSVTAPAGGVLYSQWTRPGRIDEVSIAMGTSSLRYNVFDLDFGRQIRIDETMKARGFFGTRFAYIRQSLDGFYDGVDARQARTNEELNMNGVGLSIGGESIWQVAGGLGLYGKGRGSLVLGNYQLNNRETDFGGNEIVSSFDEHFTKVVPVMELGAGVSYRFRNMRTSVGYELSHWFNQVEGFTWVDDFAEGKRVRRPADLSLESVTFQFLVEY